MGRYMGGAVTWARSPGGRKFLRYSMVSVIAVAVSQVILAITFGLLHWTARSANVTAVALSAVPSYMLNRAWVWKKTDRSSVMREIVPFWAMAFVGLVFSTWMASLAAGAAPDISSSRTVQTMIVMAASLAAFGLLWVGKFAVLNRVLFGAREEVPAVEGG